MGILLLHAVEKQERGLYLIVLKLKKNQRISAGKLQETSFKSGIYLYIGRARQGLKGRLKRHLKKEKKLFWHIDYLLQKAEIEEVWIKPDYFNECRIAWKVKNLSKDSLFPIKKFGSSDCRCTSHLFFLPEKKGNLESLRKKLSFEKVDIDGNQV